MGGRTDSTKISPNFFRKKEKKSKKENILSRKEEGNGIDSDYLFTSLT